MKMENGRRGLVMTLIVATIGSGSITCSSAEQTPQASPYAAVIDALQGARVVRLITDLSECTYEESGRPGPSLRSGIIVNAYIIVPDRGLYFSDAHQTLDETDQPVTEYVRYRFTTGGQLKLARTRLAGSLASKQETIVCEVPRGARFVW